MLVQETKTTRRRQNVDATELSATLEVLRSMSLQIVEVQSDMQQAVEEVCSGFDGMAQKAMRTVSIAGNVLGDKQENQQNGDLIGNVRVTLSSMMETIRDSSESSSRLAGEIQEMDTNLKSINGCLKEIEHIARGAKLVALNGSIEAARAGEMGVAFNVVAEETKHLATHAGAASDRIRETVGGLTGSLETASVKLSERAELEAEETAKSEDAAMSSLTMLSQMHELITNAMQETEKVSQSLSQDISRSIVAMQFQDRVNQRLEHVVETINEICDRIEPPEKLVSKTGKQKVIDRWTQDLSSKYTMESERSVHGGSQGNEPQEAAPGGGEFELF